jgi:hypothetical protein
VFLIAGSVTLAGVALAFMLRHGKIKKSDDVEPVEIG